MSLCRAFRLARRHASTSAWHTTPLEGRSVLRLEGADVFTFLQVSACSVAHRSLALLLAALTPSTNRAW